MPPAPPWPIGLWLILAAIVAGVTIVVVLMVRLTFLDRWAKDSPPNRSRPFTETERLIARAVAAGMTEEEAQDTIDYMGETLFRERFEELVKLRLVVRRFVKQSKSVPAGPPAKTGSCQCGGRASAIDSGIFWD